MKISVIGCGRWGSFLSWYLDLNGHDVVSYGRSTSAKYRSLLETRKNDVISYPASIRMTSDIDDALSHADNMIISIGAQGLRDFFENEISGRDLSEKTIILCMKGLEENTGKRLTEIVSEYTTAKTAIWVGPGHVQNFVKGIPNCMVIDSADEETKHRLVDELSGGLIRFYYGNDLIGNEIGAASKNVIGLAAGMLDGLGYSSLKGPLIARGPQEISRLIGAMGGCAMSAFGLAHLGDFEATVFSEYSHNRMFGENFIKGERTAELAEGVSTSKALDILAKKYDVELPICSMVYSVLYNRVDPEEALSGLFLRNIKNEFY